MKLNIALALVGGILALPLDGNLKSEFSVREAAANSETDKLQVRHDASVEAASTAVQMDYPSLKRHLGDGQKRQSDTEDKSHEWNRDVAVEDGARWSRRSPDKTPDDKWPRTPNPEDATAIDMIWGRNVISNVKRQEVSPDSTSWDDKRDARVARLPAHDGKRTNTCRGDGCKRQGQHQTHGQGANDWGRRGEKGGGNEWGRRGGPYETQEENDWGKRGGPYQGEGANDLGKRGEKGGGNEWGKRGGPYHTDDKLEKKVREAGDSGGPWKREGSAGESVPDWDNRVLRREAAKEGNTCATCL